MINDLSSAIMACAVTITVTRHLPSPVEYGSVSGKAPKKVFDIQASVQPLGVKEKQRELQMMPEGMRNSGLVKVFTVCELFTVKTSTCQIPDRFDYRGVTYQVQGVDDWFDLGGYYQIIATRMGT
jgi:hypothetical protein